MFSSGILLQTRNKKKNSINTRCTRKTIWRIDRRRSCIREMTNAAVVNSCVFRLKRIRSRAKTRENIFLHYRHLLISFEACFFRMIVPQWYMRKLSGGRRFEPDSGSLFIVVRSRRKRNRFSFETNQKEIGRVETVYKPVYRT